MRVNCTISSYVHDKHLIFASILLITYKRILYVNDLKRIFLNCKNIKIILSKSKATNCEHIRNKEHNRYLKAKNFLHITQISSFK